MAASISRVDGPGLPAAAGFAAGAAGPGSAAGAALGALRGGGALPQPSRPATTTTITALMERASTRWYRCVKSSRPPSCRRMELREQADARGSAVTVMTRARYRTRRLVIASMGADLLQSDDGETIRSASQPLPLRG